MTTTISIREEVLALYAKGQGISEIARALGRSRQRVSQIIHEERNRGKASPGFKLEESILQDPVETQPPAPPPPPSPSPSPPPPPPPTPPLPPGSLPRLDEDLQVLRRIHNQLINRVQDLEARVGSIMDQLAQSPITPAAVPADRVSDLEGRFAELVVALERQMGFARSRSPFAALVR